MTQREKSGAFSVGLMHVEPFTQKLELHGWQVEPIDLSTERWFQERYKYFRTYEEETKVTERWCEYLTQLSAKRSPLVGVVGCGNAVTACRRISQAVPETLPAICQIAV